MQGGMCLLRTHLVTALRRGKGHGGVASGPRQHAGSMLARGSGVYGSQRPVSSSKHSGVAACAQRVRTAVNIWEAVPT